VSPSPQQPGLRDELITAELARTLESVDKTLTQVEALSHRESIERLGKHLLRVARRMSTPSDVEQFQQRLDAVNAAVLALGDDFAGDQVVVPASLLKGIRRQEGLAAGALPPQPMMPLTSSELLVNGAHEPSLGSALIDELRCADEVDLICAFVGYTGFEPLRHEFRDLIERGGKVRVVTSTYLGSTSGKALDELVRLGADVRVNYRGNVTKLHAKAWLFRRPGELDTAFIGSSNLSTAALFNGLEWNVRLARADAPSVFQRIQQTFDSYWNAEGFEEYLTDDRPRLDEALAAARGMAADGISRRASKEIGALRGQLQDAYRQIHLIARPHQQRVLDTLQLRRERFDEHRHLVVAATGTGKTVMAALDYARMVHSGHRPRLMFVAHREVILRQARAVFRKALQDPSFGELLTGGAGPLPRDSHVFAMVQTLQNRLEDVGPDAYEVMYIDEAHHATASSWQRVIQHFAPIELVGLTATPERTDGGSVAELFGGVFTTELRLWEAVDDQLLSPFEYVGVDDGTDLRRLQWRNNDYPVGELSELYTGDHERVKLILDALNRWIEVPAHMRALGFCVSKQHAQFMAEQFTERGLDADFLTGEDDHDRREEVLARLASGALQAVFSVEVLGEGVDVPDVDTLLLLRPTQSQVLFTQQLGRGLRLSSGKDRCLVLDFIGQHHAEYRYEERYRALLNPARGSVREQAEREFPFLPAGCAITLERIARERVLAGLRAVAASTGTKALTRDLVALGSTSLGAFLDATGRSVDQLYGADGRRMSWTRLQRLAGRRPSVSSSPKELQPPQDAELLRRIGFFQHVSDPLRVDTWTEWLTGSEPPSSPNMSVFQQRLAVQLVRLLNMRPATLQAGFDALWAHGAVRSEIVELLALQRAGLDSVTHWMPGLDDVPLLAHARYTRQEVLAALGVGSVDKPLTHQSGTLFVEATRKQLLFVTLHKDTRRFSSSIQYRDHAITDALFHWESPNNWRQGGDAMTKCIGEGPSGSQHRLLFVREQSTGPIEGTFRCFGQVDLDGELAGDRPVALTWRLRQRLPEHVFEAASLVVAS
jgi:superfamily II DNA or RNA helicase/HKD family nuclease